MTRIRTQAMKEADKRYRESEKGKANILAYSKSEKAKRSRENYRKSRLGKISVALYRKSEKRKAVLKRYYESGKGKVAIKKYHSTEKGRESLSRGTHKRRANMRLVKCDLTLQQWIEIKTTQRQRCAICGELKPLTRDHIIPLSKGGQHTAGNIQALCLSCNSRKNNH